jgi:ATP synthase protein I
MSGPNAAVPAASGPQQPAGALLRGALVPTLVAAVLAIGVSLLAGPDGATGTAVGAGLAIAAFVAGPLLLRASARWQPVMVMAVAMITYGVIVIALGAAYTLLNDATWLSQRHVGLGAGVCTVVWLAAQLRAASRLRVLAFGTGTARQEHSI